MNQHPRSAADHSATPSDVDPSAANSRADFDRYGIVEVPVMTYEWGGYRYSNPTDALAAARRAAR